MHVVREVKAMVPRVLVKGQFPEDTGHRCEEYRR